jgi:hypothetical protein
VEYNYWTPVSDSEDGWVWTVVKYVAEKGTPLPRKKWDILLIHSSMD